MHRNSKVWVVDDDSSIRWVLERALNQAGIDNESFADGDQLLRRIASEQPDVIISDIRMPPCWLDRLLKKKSTAE